MVTLSDQEFEQIVKEAMEMLPEDLAQKVHNIDIFVEDFPGPDVQSQMRVSQNGLLGLYSGVPQNHRTPSSYGNVLPDRIYLYKKNLESYARNAEELKEQIQRTVLHELGHYFGIDDKRLRELGY